ncbi:zinc-binding dehydrogenase [Rhodovulum sp. YEN HP10]|uniref:zinc-binding dehydrogenase n=1 Tax=Rhodovulum sp. HP10 TaxID=3387397 RepID=UPI0039E1640B
MSHGIRTFDPTLPGSGPEGVDLVIDGVGFGATRAAASAALRPGGAMVHIGLGDAGPGFDIRRATLQKLTFIGSYTCTAEEFRDTAAALFEGRLGGLGWVRTMPLDEGAAAFASIAGGGRPRPRSRFCRTGRARASPGQGGRGAMGAGLSCPPP